MANARRTAKKPRQYLKIPTVGMEAEFFVIDNNGLISDSADEIISEAKLANELVDVKQECAKNMIEFGCKPHFYLHRAFLDLIGGIEHVLKKAHSRGLMLYPYGTYPGKFEPVMRTTGLYGTKSEVFGSERFKIAGRCIGFHFHKVLPWGVFDRQTKDLKQLSESKIKRTVVDVHNLCIASDPAITTLMQSSPFYQGKHIGQDSRVIVYRGGNILGYPEGYYAKLQEFGGLPNYKAYGKDLIYKIKEKYLEWARVISQARFGLRPLAKYPSQLDTTWNPVRINSLGTIEVRGMDMNLLSYTAAASTLLTHLLREVQTNYLSVKPTELAVKEPFRLEGNTILVPPSHYVRKKLQYLSAYEGLSDWEISKYCKAFVKLAKAFVPAEARKLLRPINKVLEEGKTVSDHILREAGFRADEAEAELPNEVAAELAIRAAEHFEKDLAQIKQQLKLLSS